MDTPANENELFWTIAFLLKTSHCLCLITGQSERWLGDSIHIVVRERHPKNETSCNKAYLTGKLFIPILIRWIKTKTWIWYLFNKSVIQLEYINYFRKYIISNLCSIYSHKNSLYFWFWYANDVLFALQTYDVIRE
jgi:hypothetical protein